MLVEILKQPGQSAQQQPTEIKAASLKTTKKGKTVLQLCPTGSPSNTSSQQNPSGGGGSEKRPIVLAGEEGELTMWLVDIDRALDMANKGTRMCS